MRRAEVIGPVVAGGEAAVWIMSPEGSAAPEDRDLGALAPEPAAAANEPSRSRAPRRAGEDVRFSGVATSPPQDASSELWERPN